MKLTFQTFCLVFLVTMIHLVVIAVFAPVTERASSYLANLDLDLENVIENGIEDYEASLDNMDEGGSEEATGEFDTDRAAAWLQFIPGEDPIEDPNEVPVEDPKEGLSIEMEGEIPSLRDAITDSRSLADQVTVPAIEPPVSEVLIAEAPVTEVPVTEAPVVEAPVVEAPVAEPDAILIAEPVGLRRGDAVPGGAGDPVESNDVPTARPGEPAPKVRSFRPVPGS